MNQLLPKKLYVGLVYQIISGMFEKLFKQIKCFSDCLLRDVSRVFHIQMADIRGHFADTTF